MGGSHYLKPGPKPLRVIVVGSGIGGLTTAIALKQAGHEVLVLEQTAQLGEVGAGIQIPPNASRILRRLGLLAEVLEHATQPSGNVMRRYADDSELCSRTHSRPASDVYGDPMLVIHRADLHRVLHQAAVEEKVQIITSCKVVDVDNMFEARVKTSSGGWIDGDVLIGADGIHSIVRDRLTLHLGLEDYPIPTGDAAYRVAVPRSKLIEEKEILDHLDGSISTRWMGPGGHIMAYPMRKDASLYNMVFVHPLCNDKVDETNLWSRKGSHEEMTDTYKDWSPTVRRLISYVEPAHLMEWPLNVHATLPTWTLNKVALVGDSCHPMLPYVAQGAAQAIEDAGVLAVCFSNTTNVQDALSVYQDVRKDRAEYIQNSALSMRTVLHLPDGPLQENRDWNMKNAGKAGAKHPDLWADSSFQQFMWGVDVMQDAKARWEVMPMNT